MKNLKLFLFTIFIVLFTFTSCTNDEAVEIPDAESSASVRLALTELETHFNEDGSLNATNNPVGNVIFDFCFDFVYPITLTYNTGAEIVVNSFPQLIEILLSSTDTLFINGISFPFQVETFVNGEIVISTINNEQEFIELLASCDFNGNDDEDCVCTEEYDPVCVEVDGPNGGEFVIEFPNACYALCEGFTPNNFVDCEDDGNPTGNDECFEYVFPISITVQNQTITFDNVVDLEIFIFGNGEDFEFVYPFQVTVFGLNGSSETITINNEADYIALLEACNENPIDCEDKCPEDGPVVCVEVNGGIVEYGSPCLAACAGFTPNDFVDCNPTNVDCEIINVVITVGDCVDNGNYTITLDFDVVNQTNDYFDLYSYNGVFLSTFSISELPLTITLTDQPNTNNNSFNIVMNDNADCSAEISWKEPNCNPGGDCEDECPDVIDIVCVQTNNGEIIEFNNECLAFCAGYTPNNFVDCDDDSPNEGEFAEVVSVQFSGSANEYNFSVGVLSPDTGCDQYADWWEVLTLNGELIYRRILTHSHVNEQPFVRSGGPVDINEDQFVIIRAHMNTSSYGFKTYKGSVAEGFLPFETGLDFATDLENQEPLPDGCAF
jgi:hypothetical protein